MPRLCDLKKGISVDIYEATGNCSKQGRKNSTTWLVMEKFVRQTTRYLSEHSVFAALFISLVLHVEICGAHWEYSLESDSHQHHNQYHERFNEAAIRSRDEHVRHQEEYAEYATRYSLLALKDFPFHVRVCLYTFCSCECIFVDMYQGHCSQKENRESSRLQPFNWLDVILASLMKIVFTTVVNWPWYSPFS